MAALVVFLRTGRKVSLEGLGSVDDFIKARPRLQTLHSHLEAHYRRTGNTEPQARATAEIDNLLRAAFTDFADAFIAPKEAAIKRLFELQGEVLQVYDDVLRSRRREVQVDFKALHGKYREMQTLFTELAKPGLKIASETGNANTKVAARAISIAPTSLPAGTTFIPASSRLNTLIGRKGWTRLADGGMRAKLKKGTVEIRVKNDLLEVVSAQTGQPAVSFKEFDVLPKYGSKPRSTRVMQAHHGVQDAVMARAFGKYGYDGQQAPTIWLRDSTEGSPHGIITHKIQNPNKAVRLEDPSLSYGKIRDWAVADLKAAGASDDAIRAYLKAMDDYFDKNILPKLPANRRAELLGDRKAY
jgi:hypothetical protein